MEFEGSILNINPFIATTIGIIVLFSGRKINKAVPLFKELTIPEPVTGGLLFAFLFLGVYLASGIQVAFNMEVRDVLIIYFFTTIGINASVKDILTGGKPFFILLAITLFYLLLQNSVGIGAATLLGVSPGVGLIGSSVSLIGGHGTAIAWAPTFKDVFSIHNAMEIGLASATLGLILSSIIGGPIAKVLINKHGLKGPEQSTKAFDIGIRKKNEKDEVVSFYGFIHALLGIHISIICGYLLNDLFTEIGFKLPLFVTCLLSAIILTNIFPKNIKSFHWPTRTFSIALIAEVSLGLFLAMSLMNMQLWTLVDLAGPIAVILGSQVVVALIYTYFVVFNTMGRNYDAAVLSAGFGGISLGATPTAIMNMTAVTEKYGPSHMAFFIDIINAAAIQITIGVLGG